MSKQHRLIALRWVLFVVVFGPILWFVNLFFGFYTPRISDQTITATGTLACTSGHLTSYDQFHPAQPSFCNPDSEFGTAALINNQTNNDYLLSDPKNLLAEYSKTGAEVTVNGKFFRRHNFFKADYISGLITIESIN